MKKKIKVAILNLPIPAWYNKIQKGNCNIFKDYFNSILLQNKIDYIESVVIKRDILESYNNKGLIEIFKKENIDIVCFSSYLWNIERNIAIAKELKENGVITITGGPEINNINQYIFNEGVFDYYIKGEGEYALLNLLEKIYNKIPINEKIIESYTPVNFNEFLTTYIKITNDYLYDGLFYLEIERGCPYTCSYCLYGKSRKEIHSIDFELFKYAIEEIYNKQVEEIYLLAPTFNRNRKLFNDYLEYISTIKNTHEKQIKIFSEIRIEFLTDNEIKLLKEAGCHEIEFGIQTMDIKKYKNLNREAIKFDFVTLTKKLIENGIEPLIDFIIGLPDESYNDIIDSIEFLDKNNFLKYSHFYQLHLLAGSTIREEFEKKGFLYQKKSPYYILNNNRIDYNDIKTIYYYLEKEKGLSYFEEFYDFNEENFYIIKKYSDLNKIKNSYFYHIGCFIYLDYFDYEVILDFFSFFLSKNSEIFFHLFGYVTKINETFLEKLHNLFVTYKNYYDYFKDNINFNPKFSQSKRITLLLTPDTEHRKIEKLSENYIVDYIIFDTSLLKSEKVFNFLKEAYYNQGMLTHVFKNSNVKKYEFINIFPLSLV